MPIYKYLSCLLFAITLSACFDESTVTPDTVRNITVTWERPTERQDGGPLALDEIYGYKIHYSLSSSEANETTIETFDGSAESYDLTLNETGEYTFTITTIDTDLVESVSSASYTVTVD